MTMFRLFVSTFWLLSFVLFSTLAWAQDVPPILSPSADALGLLTSAGFAIAVVALLRKRWPSIDGWWVTAIYVGLTILGAVLAHFSDRIPVEVWTTIKAIAVIVTGQGGVTLWQQVAGKGSKTTNVKVVPSDPVVNTKPATADDLADAVLANLNCDTKPGEAPQG
jgi:hypothetical protein